jgi:hypothetical protein
MTSRVDHEGALIGYYKAPLGQIADAQKLIPPWDYVHFRLLGGKKKRPRFSDPMYTEFRTMHLLVGMDIKQVTTKYGTSLLMNALPCYRRLRLAEDSLLLARLSRGLIRYIWKLKVSHCLKGDTKVSLMDGTTPTIQEMAENLNKYIGKYVLTVNEETRHLEPNKIKNAQKTRLNAQLVRVYLDNDKYVDTTPDHKFMMRDGSYKEAKDLQSNDSLMPYYHCLSEKGIRGYQLVYDPGYGQYRYEHRVAVGKLKKGQIPHHKDFNKLNNDPSNFIIFPSQSEHCIFHHEHNEKYGWAISASRPKTKEHVEKVVESRRGNGKPWHSEETIGKISVAHQKEKEKRVCPACGNTFEVNPSSRKKYCNLECAHIALLLPRETRICGCGCEGTFECKVDSKKRFIRGHNNRGENNPHYGKSYPAWNEGLTKETDERVALNAERMAQTKRAKGVEKRKAQLMECLLNHKVVRIEWLKKREDTYDIEIENTPNFPLEVGVFVHNSSMEAVGELVDQYSTVLREARALNTRPGAEAGFEEKENPMCLRGDTQIRLCNGKDVTIKEMAENSDRYVGKYILSVNLDTLEIEPDEIVKVCKTRLNAQLVRVYLNNNKCHVDCTPDHKFMLQNGIYKEAQDLQPNDSLMTYCYEIKVVKVERLEKRGDTYDITTKKNHNFSLEVGIFVHNSCIEDIFLPVWDNVGDLTYDKIGGEADIRWIKDVEDLRQQLAAALRCPLPLLGAYLKEAAGPLGSEIIEKVDINFARIARKLQRTVRNGIKRICQIHLAWMNMDPDPNLFDIQMPEMSTAEEESLKDSLNSGTDVIAKFMSMMDDIEGEGGKKIDRVEVFNYLNEKILKLEDFDLTEFMTSIEAIPECRRRSERKAKEEKARGILEKAREVNSKNGGIERKGPQFDTDLFSYVPTTIYDGNGKLYENRIKKFRGWLGKERCMHVWESKFSQVKVIPEGADMDVKQGQKLLPFAK